ncbi:DUF445 domain-containing protein [Burkholderia cepacia]|uniref:DUF445 domain-containing protein n=1 Tax=Burkholderia cepacia TaxID=292 RepID=UPI000757C4AE|nr:DUF445 domain-containing protein [Burkholderia cepacia]KVL22096.1 hypothetical protein WJ46_09360 [Burkholderia cepacia]KVQ23250.1 hypothetical protein WK02_31745 [Burkholderia cepacia]KVZ19560.1 hypothetical protein WL14_27910 [Burkholderia cepacia]
MLNVFAKGGEAASRSATGATEHEGALRLIRMRRIATYLLTGMAVLLIVSVTWRRNYPWLSWLQAFSEAGLVGAIADWYAVVSLFRRPFGLPIPHTGIVPKNQNRIAESLGSFVERNFLEPELIASRLSNYNAAQAVAVWISEPENQRTIADVASTSLLGLLSEIDEADIGYCFDYVVRPQLRTLDVCRIAGFIAKAMVERKLHQSLLDQGLPAVEKWLMNNAGVVGAKFSAASRYTPAPFDAYIVRKFLEGIVALLREVASDPEHELRRQFDAGIQHWIAQLLTSPALRRAGRLVVRDFVGRFGNEDVYRILLEYFRRQVESDLEREPSVIHDAIGSLLGSLGATLSREPAIQRKLNAWLRMLARELIVRHRHQLSLLIVEVVKGWDTEMVSRKVESEIGCDLQYIRINGTFVGGIVGVLLHASVLMLVA